MTGSYVITSWPMSTDHSLHSSLLSKTTLLVKTTILLFKTLISLAPLLIDKVATAGCALNNVALTNAFGCTQQLFFSPENDQSRFNQQRNFLLVGPVSTAFLPCASLLCLCYFKFICSIGKRNINPGVISKIDCLLVLSLGAYS